MDIRAPSPARTVDCERTAAPGSDPRLDALLGNALFLDTLFLSPLAFPSNPYHRLVKDYTLVRDSVSDPVEDCRLAEKILREQFAAVDARAKQDVDLLGVSVLPSWVRNRFPATVPLLKALRDLPCGRPDCGWCASVHNPDLQLERWFGFDAFRPEPAAEDGSSLQRAILCDGMADHPLLAILPTGGGKSLCFQLPALVRNLRRGTLTVVIAPLQALMKDQVDNLVTKTGSTSVAAIYGLLTPPERGDVMARVRLGDVSILYLSPEQLRNRSVAELLASREIGCWVFDEAHCLFAGLLSRRA